MLSLYSSCRRRPSLIPPHSDTVVPLAEPGSQWERRQQLRRANIRAWDARGGLRQGPPGEEKAVWKSLTT